MPAPRGAPARPAPPPAPPACLRPCPWSLSLSCPGSGGLPGHRRLSHRQVWGDALFPSTDPLASGFSARGCCGRLTAAPQRARAAPHSRTHTSPVPDARARPGLHGRPAPLRPVAQLARDQAAREAEWLPCSTRCRPSASVLRDGVAAGRSGKQDAARCWSARSVRLPVRTGLSRSRALRVSGMGALCDSLTSSASPAESTLPLTRSRLRFLSRVRFLVGRPVRVAILVETVKTVSSFRPSCRGPAEHICCPLDKIEGATDCFLESEVTLGLTVSERQAGALVHEGGSGQCRGGRRGAPRTVACRPDGGTRALRPAPTGSDPTSCRCAQRAPAWATPPSEASGRSCPGREAWCSEGPGPPPPSHRHRDVSCSREAGRGRSRCFPYLLRGGRHRMPSRTHHLSRGSGGTSAHPLLPRSLPPHAPLGSRRGPRPIAYRQVWGLEGLLA